MPQPILLVAEIGVNHNGDMTMARELIAAAKDAGADAVKFQTFTAATLVTARTPKVRYQHETTSRDESHFEMIRFLELTLDSHGKLFSTCQSLGVEFISTPYDRESVRFLDRLGVQRFKVASADIVDLPLLEEIAQTGRPTLLSVGMATLGEIEIATGHMQKSDAGEITLMHCVSNYPCSDTSLNLMVLSTLQHAFHVPIGYSDHSQGCEAAVLSVALGATVIEKHFTLDKSLPGPDHAASATPEEFQRLATAVRRAEVMLGSPIKRRQPEEQQMAAVSRKSITLIKSKATGETIDESDLMMMRPGIGLPAVFWEDIVGKTARHPLPKHHQIGWVDVQ